jgi:hypothetical protein
VPRQLRDVPSQPTAEELEADRYRARFVIVFDQLNAGEFTYPGTKLRLFYSMAGQATIGELGPDQIPADQ